MINININQYIEAISRIRLFSTFTKDELSRVLCLSKYVIKEYDKGQIIYLKNERCQTMDIIINGRVSVQNVDENGNVLTINVFNDSDVIGAGLLFSSRNHYPMIIAAASRTTILHMQRELVLELCQRNVSFMKGLMNAISDTTVILTDKINAISLKTIRKSIIDFLKYEHHIQKSDIIKLNISKKELAERLGIQRSSLSRELDKMRKDGLLEFDSKTIKIINIDLDKELRGNK